MSDVTYTDLANTALSLLKQYNDLGVEERKDTWFFLECAMRNALIAIKNKEQSGETSKWRPIETAPKDVQILVWIPITRLWWPAWVEGSKLFSNAHGQLNEKTEDRREPIIATHWMPMPGAPNE